MENMFDDLIPQNAKGPQAAPYGDLSFDDLIPVANGGTKAPLPMFAQNVPDQFEDVAKSGGVGIAKGLTGAAGSVGSLGQLWDSAPAYITDKALRGLEKIGAVSPGTADELSAYIQKTNREWRSPAEQQGLVNKIAGVPFATPRGFDSIVQSAAGPYYEPKTRLGQYSERVGEFLPGAAVAPGGMSNIVSNSLKYGVAPGLASEAAGQATEGTALEPWARGAAALGTAGAAAYMSAPAYAERMAGRAINGASEQQLAQAQRLMQDAEARGIRLTVDEAIQHVTDGATNAGNLRRVVESTTEGNQRFAPAMAARPGQMNSAMDAELNRISPQAPRPYDVAPQVQEVGVDAMQAAERMRTRASSPYYRAAEADRVNPNAVRSIVGGIDNQMAQDSTGVLSGPLGQTRNLLVERQGQPAIPAARTPVLGPDGSVIRYESTPARDAIPEVLATDIPNLDRARKFVRDQNELPPFAAQAIPKEAAAAQGNILTELRNRMERASPNFAQGRQEYERLSRSVVDPMANSPTGQLANAATPEAQRSILFPQNPLPGSERGIGNAVGSIANRTPDLARQVVRQEAEMRANNTVRGLDNAGRPDQFGGAKFARQMRDNPQVAANFDAALARAGGDPSSMSRLVDVLQATGQRQRPGSMTAFNKEALDDMKRGGVQSIVQALTKPLQTTKDVVARRRLGTQAERLADALLAGPEGVDRLRQIASEGSGNRNALIRALIGGNTALLDSRR